MEVVELIDKASAAATKVAGNVKTDQLGDPTPCDEFDVRGLINHLLGAMLIQAEAAETGKGTMPEEGDLFGDDIAKDFGDAQKRLVAAWSQPGVMDKTLELPWGTFPASMYAGMVFVEGIVHGWDLAKATGQDFDVDPALAEAALDYLTPIDAMLRQPGVYGAKVDVPADAPALDRLIAFAGRTP
jgi:uncharacterized protein (TIGR03086 family)